MAPEETSTTSRRLAASAERRRGRRPGSRSSPPAAVVSDDEPTLTTIRRAAVTCSRTRPLCAGGCVAQHRFPYRGVTVEDYTEDCVVARRADPARAGDVVRRDRRVPRQRGGPRQVGAVMARHGGGVPWHRVVDGERPAAARPRAGGLAPAPRRGHPAARGPRRHESRGLVPGRLASRRGAHSSGQVVRSPAPGGHYFPGVVASTAPGGHYFGQTVASTAPGGHYFGETVASTAPGGH